MGISVWMVKRLFIMILILFAACSDDKNIEELNSADTQPVKEYSNFYGWSTITLNNSYVQLDVVPDLGGKIMGFSFLGSQILWHNPIHEGEIKFFVSSANEGQYISPGGSNVWSSLQDASGAPPALVFNNSLYSYKRDGKSITVTSPADTVSGRTSIQYTHTYSLVPRSSQAELNLSMTNRTDTDISLALCHLTTIPADSAATFYAPVAKETDWHVLSGDRNSSQWLGVENGLLRAKLDTTMGKIGMKVSEGWAAWHNTQTNIAYVIRFPLPQNSKHLYNDNNVVINSSGIVKDDTGTINPELSNIELQVLGPITNLLPNERSTLDITWSVCNVSDIYQVKPVCVIANKINYISEYNTIIGRFGVFYGGTIVEQYYDKEGENTSRIRLMDASPLSEIILQREIYIPNNTIGVRYELWNYNNEYLGEIADIKLPEESLR